MIKGQRVISGDGRLFQLQTFIQTFAVPPIGHIAWSRCASLVARPGEIFVMRCGGSLRMKSNVAGCEMDRIIQSEEFKKKIMTLLKLKPNTLLLSCVLKSPFRNDLILDGIGRCSIFSMKCWPPTAWRMEILAKSASCSGLLRCC